MATKKTASKSVKTATNSKVTNPLVVNAYSNLASATRESEIKFIYELASMLDLGKTSIRIARASIKEASAVSGNAPTFRASHVEGVQISARLLKLEGADKAKISDILKLADRIRTAFGIDEGVQGVENWSGTFAELETETPTIAETRAEKAGEKAEAEDKPAKVESVESVLKDTLKRIKGLGDIRSLKTSDLEQLLAVMETLKVIAKNSKAA